MSIKARIKALTKDYHLNDCTACKDFNGAAYYLEMVIRSGKHVSEVEVPDYVCPVCNKVPQRDQKQMGEDYGRLIVGIHAGITFKGGFPCVQN